MSDRDTWIGGAGREFRTTCWSRILNESEGQDHVPWETLSTDYWKPVYTYIRIRWAKSNEDAKDLTQEFFVWMMESDFVRRSDPARGRFRAFLRTCLEHFLTDQNRRAGARKRGGDRKILSLDEEFASAPGWEPPDGSGRSPGQMLDQVWIEEIFSRALQELETQFRKEGREVAANVFRDYFLSESEDLDYHAVADRYGITWSQVSNCLVAAKKRFRTIVTDCVADTVQTAEELKEELRFLFGDEDE